MNISFLDGEMDFWFPLCQGTIPTKPRFRSVPDVVVLNSQIPLPAGLLIKYQRLPRGFFWNSPLTELLF